MAFEGDQRWSSSVVLKHCCRFYLLSWMLLHFLFMAGSASPLFSKFVCNFPFMHGESNPGVTFHSPVARAEWCSPKYRTSGTRGLAPARIPLLPRLSLASLLCRALQWRPGGRRWRGAGGVIRNSSQSVSQSQWRILSNWSAYVAVYFALSSDTLARGSRPVSEAAGTFQGCPRVRLQSSSEHHHWSWQIGCTRLNEVADRPSVRLTSLVLAVPSQIACSTFGIPIAASHGWVLNL